MRPRGDHAGQPPRGAGLFAGHPVKDSAAVMQSNIELKMYRNRRRTLLCDCIAMTDGRVAGHSF